MIINLIFFIFLSVVSLMSLSGYGILLNYQNKKDFLLNIIFGHLILAILITFIHFIFKINLIIIFSIFITGLLLNLKNHNYNFKNIKKKNYLYLLIFLVLIPIYISQKYHEDFGYYHLPYIINLANEKIIFGLGNVNDGFIHNSIWLNILSIFYINNNYNFVTLPTFLLYFTFFIYAINQILFHKKYSYSNYFLIICVFYLILKFTRISEFGNDIPALIFSIFAIFFFLKYNEENDFKKKNYFFFSHTSFVVFAILVKFSVIPIFILTIYIFLRDFKIINKEILRYNYLILYLLVILFLIQQFIYTGCFIFPSKITCLNVSWFSEKFLSLRNDIELINKSYSEANSLFSKKEYLMKFNWVTYWFKRNYLEFIEHLLTMFIPIILFLFLLKRKATENKKIYRLSIFIFFLVMGFSFWFIFSPVYRFGILYFLCLFFVITVQFYRRKIFSQKIFLFLIILFLTFNLVKNINRINQKNYINFGIDKIDNEYSLYDGDFDIKAIPVYKPNTEANNQKGNGWQGRLCWDIPFLCSYNELSIKKKYGYLFVNK